MISYFLQLDLLTFIHHLQFQAFIVNPFTTKSLFFLFIQVQFILHYFSLKINSTPPTSPSSQLKIFYPFL